MECWIVNEQVDLQLSETVEKVKDHSVHCQYSTLQTISGHLMPCGIQGQHTYIQDRYIITIIITVGTWVLHKESTTLHNT